MRKALFTVVVVLLVSLVSGCAPKATPEQPVEYIIRQEVVTTTPEPITAHIIIFWDPDRNGLPDEGAKRLVSGYVKVYNTRGEAVDEVVVGDEKAEPFLMTREEVLQFVLLIPGGYEATTPSDVVVDGSSVLGRTSRIYFGLARIPTPTPTPTHPPTATLTATAAPTSTPEPSESPPPPDPEGEDLEKTVQVILRGDLRALKINGSFVWSAVRLECTLPNGSTIMLPFTDGGQYAIPPNSSVKFWIGEGLGGADWWKSWYSPPAAVVGGVVVLTISKIESEPQFNGRPYPSPTPRGPDPTRTPRIPVPTPRGTEPVAPTNTPLRPTLAPTPTAYPPAKTPTRGPMRQVL